MSVVEYLLRLDRRTAIFSVTVGFCYIQLLYGVTFTVVICMQLILRTVMEANSCKSNPKKGMEVAACHTVFNKYGPYRNNNIRRTLFQNLLTKIQQRFKICFKENRCMKHMVCVFQNIR